MKRFKRFVGVAIVLVLAVLLYRAGALLWSVLSSPNATATPKTLLPSSRTVAFVTGIVDGDTIYVNIADRPFTLRYIGIDTPEMDSPSGPVAREANRQLVEGQIVYLEKDVSDTDRYGRLLRYVYLADGTFVNAELVRQGYAIAKAYPPDIRHHRQLSQLQGEAQRALRGLWKATPTPPVPSGAGAPSWTLNHALAALPVRALVGDPQRGDFSSNLVLMYDGGQ